MLTSNNAQPSRGWQDTTARPPAAASPFACVPQEEVCSGCRALGLLAIVSGGGPGGAHSPRGPAGRAALSWTPVGLAQGCADSVHHRRHGRHLTPQKGTVWHSSLTSCHVSGAMQKLLRRRRRARWECRHPPPPPTSLLTPPRRPLPLLMPRWRPLLRLTFRWR